MGTARVFKSGNSQAVRLPKEFRFSGKEVEILRRGDEVILREKSKGLGRVFDIVANLDLDWDAIEQLKKERPEERDFDLAPDPKKSLTRPRPQGLQRGAKAKRRPRRKRA